MFIGICIPFFGGLLGFFGGFAFAPTTYYVCNSIAKLRLFLYFKETIINYFDKLFFFL